MIVRRIIHCTESHACADEKIIERRKRAQQSWQTLYANGVISCQFCEPYYRSSRVLGDRRALPFLKDVLAAGLRQAKTLDDIVFLTNDDSILHPALPAMLKAFISCYDVCTSFRVECHGTLPALSLAPEEIDRESVPHVGRDLFGATARWFYDHWTEIGDVILGSESWDWYIAAFIRHQKGYLSTSHNMCELCPYTELPRGYLLHEAHSGEWLRHTDAPATMHNLKIFKKWAEIYCPTLPFNEYNRLC